MSGDHPVDPFEALREPLVPLAPDPTFAARLRRRLVAGLGHTDPRRDPDMSTSSTTGTAGLRPLVPYLTCSPASDAIDWYVDVFGAEVVGEVHPMGDGLVGHAELRIGEGTLYLSDELTEVGAVSPRTAGAATTAFVLEVADVDATYQRAVDAGASADRPPVDQPYGSRAGWLTDPFGHRWSLATPLTPGGG